MPKFYFILILFFQSCNFGGKTKPENDTLTPQKQANLSAKDETIDSSFLVFFEEFTEVLKSRNQVMFRELVFDSLGYEDKYIGANLFMKSYFSIVFNDDLISTLSDKNQIDFISSEIEPSYLPLFIKNQISTGICLERIVNITISKKYPPIIIVLTFLKTQTGFKLYKYDRIG